MCNIARHKSARAWKMPSHPSCENRNLSTPTLLQKQRASAKPISTANQTCASASKRSGNRQWNTWYVNGRHVHQGKQMRVVIWSFSPKIVASKNWKQKTESSNSNSRSLWRKCMISSEQVSWSRRSGPHVPLLLDVSFPPCFSVSRLPQRRDRVPFRCGPGSTHHPMSRLRSEAEHPKGLALTRGWYTEWASTGGSFVVNVVDRTTSVKSR